MQNKDIDDKILLVTQRIFHSKIDESLPPTRAHVIQTVNARKTSLQC